MNEDNDSSIQICGHEYDFDWLSTDTIDPFWSTLDKHVPKHLTYRNDECEEERPSLERVQKALEHISPDIGWEEWSQYGMAICEAFEAPGDSEKAYRIFDRWSQPGATYSRKQLRSYWRGWKRRDQQATPVKTLRSLYKRARENGWDGRPYHVKHALTRETKPQASTVPSEPNEVRIAEWLGVEPAWFDMSAPVEQELRKRFEGYNHTPSEEQWQGILEIPKAIEAMARGKWTEDFAITSLSPGLGKTQSVTNTIFYIYFHRKDLLESGIIWFIEQIEAIDIVRNELIRSGVPENAIGILHSHVSRDEKASNSHKPILLTTQQGLLQRASNGEDDFLNIFEYYYNKFPRKTRIWDEEINIVRTITVPKTDFNLLLSHNIGNNRLKDWFKEVETLVFGLEQRVPIIKLPEPVGLSENEFTKFFTDNQKSKVDSESIRNIATNIYRLCGKNARWVDNQAINWEEQLPSNLAPMLVLDASGRVRKTYSLWQKHRGNILRLYSPPKDYKNLSISHTNVAAGQDKLRDKGKQREIAVLVDETIRKEAKYKGNDKILIFTMKEFNESFEVIFDELGLTSDFNVTLETWGRHRSTNQYADYEHVILIGLLSPPKARQQALARGSANVDVDQDFEDTKVESVRRTEIQSAVWQAANRSRVRKSEGNGCPTSTLWVIGNSREINSTELEALFPGTGAVLQVFSQGIEKAHSYIGREQQRMLNIIEEYVGVSELKFSTLANNHCFNKSNIPRMVKELKKKELLPFGVEITRGGLRFN